MQKEKMNYCKYIDMAEKYGFSGNTWTGKKKECTNSVKDALNSIIHSKDYIIEMSDGDEVCININPCSLSGRIRGRDAGIYILPRKGQARVVLNARVYRKLKELYELPKFKEKNGQYQFMVSFEGLCSFCEIITSL